MEAQAERTKRTLRRPSEGRVLGGVCAGIAEHFGADVTVVRLLWVLLTLVTGLLAGVVTYLVAWMLAPAGGTAPSRTRRLRRSRSDRRIAGVVGGLAEALDVDAMILRLFFVFVTLLTAVLPGVLTYLLAWLIVPLEDEQSQGLGAYAGG